MWLELAETVDTVALYDRARAAGIVLSPGTLFSVSGKYKNAMRVNFSCEATHDTEQAYKKLVTLIG